MTDDARQTHPGKCEQKEIDSSCVQVTQQKNYIMKIQQWNTSKKIKKWDLFNHSYNNYLRLRLLRYYYHQNMIFRQSFETKLVW